MTTNKEALQKIFEAALKEPEPQPTPTTRLRCYVPANHAPQASRHINPAASPAPQRASQTVHIESTAPVTSTQNIAQEIDPKKAAASDSHNTTTHDASPAGSPTLINPNVAEGKRRNQTQWVLLAAIFAGGLGGSTAWFLQSPEPVTSPIPAAAEWQAAADPQILAEEPSSDTTMTSSMSADLGDHTTGATEITADDSFIPSN